ncbi:MAG TPA: phosphate ABC transporter permease subunit PstC [Acidimicrobiia bacterium]|nr:phosphate ABC transporter permease subunit PstC [Acidimicrobiia bacterium]
MAVSAPPRPDVPPAPPARLSGSDRPPGRLTDRLFQWAALGAGLLVLVILGLIIYSTLDHSWAWFQQEGFGIFRDDWDPAHGQFGAGAMIYGTFLVGFIALLISVPVSVGIALFVTEVAPRRLRRPVIYTIDLLAAIPSVVYGLWAFLVLRQPLADIYSSVSSATGDIPILKTLFAEPSVTGLSYMTAGIVVAIMITPIITSLTREVFATTPTPLREAAYGLGATRWEMIRGAVFPHSRGGFVSAVMIGFGRAIGETIAVALVVGSVQQISPHVLGPGDTLAAIVANQFGEATGVYQSALIGMGVVLLAFTLVVGVSARYVVARYDRRMGAVS